MPFTPFHLGPAALLKAAVPKRFSLLVFCYAQVITDLEVAYHIMRRQLPLHTVFHTYPGALVVGLFCGVTALPLYVLAVRYYEQSYFRALIITPLTFKISVISALIGTFSHVLLDSIMHADLQPLAPFSAENVFLGSVSLAVLHLFCVVTGIIGVLWCVHLTRDR